MKIWSGLLNIFAIVIIAILLIIYYNIYQVNERQFEEIKLQYASDYAALAAFNNALKTASNQETDYSDLTQVQLSPEKVDEMYHSMMRMSYNFSENEQAEGHITNSIVSAVICEAWGYRLLEEVKYDTNLNDTVAAGDSKLQWGVLRPYIVYNSDNTRLYAANICNDKTKEYLTYDVWAGMADEGTDKAVPRILERANYEGTDISKGDVRVAVAKLLNTDLNNEISKRVSTGAYGDIDGLYISFDETMTAINSIERPTLLIAIQHSTFLDNGKKSDSYTLSGISAVPKTSVIGFTENGVKYYCYAGQPLESDGSLKVIPIEKTFDTIEEATRAGYQPHWIYLGNPKRPTAEIH